METKSVIVSWLSCQVGLKGDCAKHQWEETTLEEDL
jgi:hypothetical protein